MAAIGLAIGEVQDGADDATDRRANGMENAAAVLRRPSSEPAFADHDGIAGTKEGAERHGSTHRAGFVGPGKVDGAFCARGEKPPAIATALSTVMLGT